MDIWDLLRTWVTLNFRVLTKSKPMTEVGGNDFHFVQPAYLSNLTQNGVDNISEYWMVLKRVTRHTIHQNDSTENRCKTKQFQLKETWIVTSCIPLLALPQPVPRIHSRISTHTFVFQYKCNTKILVKYGLKCLQQSSRIGTLDKIASLIIFCIFCHGDALHW